MDNSLTAPTEDVIELFETNFFGHYTVLHKLLQKDLIRNCASIVFVSSILAHRGAANTSAYSASKGAILSFSRALASELASEQIRVNCVSPSYIDTPMTAGMLSSHENIKIISNLHPLGRIGTPRDVVEVVMFLLSTGAQWITGIDIQVDGGRSSGA